MPAHTLNLFRAAFAHARRPLRRAWVKWIDATDPDARGSYAFVGDLVPDAEIRVQVDRPRLLLACARDRDRTRYKVLRMEPDGQLKALGITMSRGRHNSSWHLQIISDVTRELRAIGAAASPAPAPAPAPALPSSAPTVSLDDDVPRTLARLLQHDPALRLEPRRVRALLSDHHPAARLEVNLLVFAAEVGVGAEGPHTPDGIKLDLGVSRLTARFGTQTSLAEWAVTAWLRALDRTH